MKKNQDKVWANLVQSRNDIIDELEKERERLLRENDKLVRDAQEATLKANKWYKRAMYAVDMLSSYLGAPGVELKSDDL
jgi:hypothetical protein